METEQDLAQQPQQEPNTGSGPNHQAPYGAELAPIKHPEAAVCVSLMVLWQGLALAFPRHSPER